MSLYRMVTGLANVALCASREASRLEALRTAMMSDLLSGDHEIPASYDRFLNGAA